MKNLFLFFATIVLALGCTNQGANHAHKNNNKTSNAGRGIASISPKKAKKMRAKRKALIRKIRKESKGLVMPTKYFTKLQLRDQKNYLGAMMSANYSLHKNVGKRQRYVYNILDFFINEADAYMCPNSGWVLDIEAVSTKPGAGQVCDSSTYGFDPETAKDFYTYAPERTITDPSIARCKTGVSGGSFPSVANSHVCPATWEYIGTGTNREARLVCDNSSSGSSPNCRDRFFSGQNKRNEIASSCKNNGNTGVKNMSCEQFNESETRFQAMHENNCSRANRDANSHVKNICAILDGIDRNLEAAAAATDAPVPEDDLDLRDESCRTLAGEALGEAEGLSEEWEGLAEIAANECGGVRNLDHWTRNKIGRCNAKIDVGDGGLNINDLVSNFSTTSDVNIREFVTRFGLTPKQYKAMVCDVRDVAHFRHRLNNPEDYINRSEIELLSSETWRTRGEREADSYFNRNTNKFEAYKNWFINNYNEYDAARRRKGLSNDDVKNHVRTGNIEITVPGGAAPTTLVIKDAGKALADKILEVMAPNENTTSMNRRIELAIASAGVAKDSLSAIALRRSIHDYLLDKVPNPANKERLDKTRAWMSTCAGQVGRDGTTAPVAGGDYTPVGSTAQCKFVRQADARAFAEGWNGETPFIIQRVGDKKCFKTDLDASARSIPDRIQSGVQQYYLNLKTPSGVTVKNGEVFFNDQFFGTAENEKSYALFAPSDHCGTDGGVGAAIAPTPSIDAGEATDSWR